MSISFRLHGERRAFPFRLPRLPAALPLFRPGVRRNNRIDLEHLPESLQRDLGLIDGRAVCGCRHAWGAAILTFPPRGL
jgi:hypothetical protein